MLNVTTEIKIDKPISIVSEYAADPDNAPEWYDNIKSVKWETNKPLKVGSKMTFVAHFLGKKLEYVYEVIELVPNHKIVMKTFEGPFPMQTTYEWKRISNYQTQMILNNQGKPKGFSILVSPLMAFMMKSANKKDLKKIKKILERKNNLT